MADYAALLNAEKKKHAPSPASTPKEVKLTPEKTDQSRTQHSNQSANQPTSQSVSQSTDQQTSKSSSISDKLTVDRPKSFYITLRLDKRLDEAVRYFQEVHGIKKVDRSILMNAILDTDENWTDEALDLLVERILQLLTNKLIR